MTRTPRRVVTGHSGEGRSIILFDDAGAPTKVLEKAGGLRLTELWETACMPVNNGGSSDAARVQMKIEPEAGGTVFRIIDYPPDSERLPNMDRQAHFSSMGVKVETEGGARHPGMHKTSTLDYAIVLEGEIYAVMDEGEVLLRAGDCLIQRGTNHAWSNRTDRPCRIAFVLVSATPVPTE